MTTARARLALGLSLGVSLVFASCGSHTVTTRAPGDGLVIKRDDGTPVPKTLPYGMGLTLQAGYPLTNEAAVDAQWTVTGPCSLFGSGSKRGVDQTGLGACTVTATANGMKAVVTFTIAAITGVAIKGDTSPLKIGETRTFVATALSQTEEVGGISVEWSFNPAEGFIQQPTTNTISITALSVGVGTLGASTGRNTAEVVLNAVPTSIHLAAALTHLRAGDSTSVTATAFGPDGARVSVVDASAMLIRGVDGFGAVGPMAIQPDGSVVYVLGQAVADCPAIVVTDVVTSNAVSITVEPVPIAAILVQAPVEPVTVGLTATFRAVPVDAAGAPVVDAGTLRSSWSDANGVFVFADATGLTVTATAVKLGQSAIVATVLGQPSAFFRTMAVPRGVLISVTPTSIAVGAMAEILVSVIDAWGMPIPNATLDQLTLSTDDPIMVSLGAGTARPSDFRYVATGLAPTGLGSAATVTATWTDGITTNRSVATPLTVTGP